MPIKAIDYSKTIIYKIVCNDVTVTDLYVGSTTDFTSRKSCHRNACNNINNKVYHLKIYQAIRANGGWDNWTMVEIEKFSCNDGNESRARERYWYDLLKAKLNTNKPCIFEEEAKAFSRQYYIDNRNVIVERRRQYHKDNRDIELEKNRQYRILNMDHIKINSQNYYIENRNEINEKCRQYRIENQSKIAEITKIKYTCDCGSIIRRGEKSRHIKTQKHISFLSKQEEEHPQEV